MAVQMRINELMPRVGEPLTVDGIAGRLTQGMIADFQAVALGFGRPDARVDPGGRTERGLNNPASAASWRWTDPRHDPQQHIPVLPKKAHAAKEKTGAGGRAGGGSTGHGSGGSGESPRANGGTGNGSVPKVVVPKNKPYRDKEGHLVVAKGAEALRVAQGNLSWLDDVRGSTSGLVGGSYAVPKGTVDLKLKQVIVGQSGGDTGKVFWIRGNTLYASRGLDFIVNLESSGLFREINSQTRAVKPASNAMAGFVMGFGTTIIGTPGLAVTAILVFTKGLVFYKTREKQVKSVAAVMPDIVQGFKFLKEKCPNFWTHLLRGLGSAFSTALSSVPQGFTAQHVAMFMGKMMGGLGAAEEVTVKASMKVLGIVLATTLPLVAATGTARNVQQIVNSLTTSFAKSGIPITEADARKMAEELGKPGVPQELEKLHAAMSNVDRLLLDLANHWLKADGHSAVRKISQADNGIWTRF
ncbi:hypothetical protein [Roseibium sp. MMSF_3412]|uniref:hypothetical protein n=1 Tax=Roseibium sp. MMSF_3412 TaxID=3046712 RepID=UPI00273DF3E7|nr:hypothetical protein [Roseibium sp. MMSF_3412]